MLQRVIAGAVSAYRSVLSAILAVFLLNIVPPPAVAATEKVAVVAIDADPGHFNPGITTGSHVHAAADSIFNGLVGLDFSLSPVPDLALRWQISPDGRIYTFDLAEAKWHDGKPFTSADVKFTFEEILLKYHARTKAGLAAVIEAIDAPNERQVVFRLKTPHGAFLRRLDVTEAPILPKHIFAAAGDPNTAPANLKPIGTGPFKLVSYKRDAEIVFERNRDYFKQGLPKLDRLVLRIIKEPATRLLALEQGEVDYLPGVPGNELARLKAKGGTSIISVSSGPGGGNCIMTVSFNLEREPLNNANIRKAVALAVDRSRMIDQILFGQGRVAAAPISSAIPWAHAAGALADLSPSPDNANALLDAAGLKRGNGGIRLKLDIIHFPTFNKYAELMKQDLARVGIDLLSRPLDREAFVETAFRKRDFDLNIISYCNGVDPEIGVRRMYVSSNIGPVPFSNAAAYRNPVVDSFFETAGKATSEAERGAQYRELQTILARDLPYWWLVETVTTAVYRSSCSGFRPWTGQLAEEADCN